MPIIRPITDLRNTTEISELCHRSQEPIFITKNGYGDMVVMSMEEYERMQSKNEIYLKLLEAEREAEATDTRFSSEEVLDAMRKASHENNV